MKRKLRFLIVIAMTLAMSAIVTRATQEQEETFGDKLKKLFVRPTPTPKHRKKKKPSLTPTVSPAPSESPSATRNPSPTESRTSSIAPSPSTAQPSETARAAPAATETRKATRVEEGQTQYLEPVRPITPRPRSRRRATLRITPTRAMTPIPTATQTPAPTQTPPSMATPAPKQTPAATSTPTEAPVSGSIPSLPPMIKSSGSVVGKSSPSPVAKKIGTPKATVSVADISDSQSYSPEVKKAIDLGLDLTTQNLSYKYASADPAKGGMDCSGFIYYVLSKCGVKDVPRDAREQYIWVRKAGNFQAVLAQRDDTFELDELKPGDLLFWASNYGISRDPDITLTMIYLGRDAERNQRLMIGASEGNAYKGKRRVGVGVFDFKFGRVALKPKQESGPVFVGYGRIPGLGGK